MIFVISLIQCNQFNHSFSAINSIRLNLWLRLAFVIFVLFVFNAGAINRRPYSYFGFKDVTRFRKRVTSVADCFFPPPTPSERGKT
jgi:hypothetical protein